MGGAASGIALDARVTAWYSAAMRPLVRRATIADAAPLSELGATTFRDTFAADNTPEDIARYLAETFTPEQQATELADPASIVLVAEHRALADDVELVGYVHLVAGVPPAAVQGPRPLELKRLYVARAWHGQGVAQSLMDAAVDAARAQGAGTLWLGVWERNPRAVAFYAKYGFTRVGEHTFMLGADAQIDWLLARPVGPAPQRRSE